jgi:hypothetical protein
MRGESPVEIVKARVSGLEKDLPAGLLARGYQVLHQLVLARTR